jgi:uncharacterized protein (TIRG00374 family)
MRSARTAVRIILSLGVSGFFVWLSLRHADVRAVAAALGAAPIAPLAGYFGILLVIHVVRTARWGLLLRPLGTLSWRRVNEAAAVGFMLLMVLPLRLGELARPLLIARDPGDGGQRIPRSGALASCVVERVVDGIAVGGLGIIALRLLGAQADGAAARYAERASWIVIAAFASLCVLLAIAYFLRAQTVTLVERVGSRFSPRLAIRVAGMLDAFSGALHLGSGARVIAIFALTAVHWALHALGFWLLAPAFGMKLTLLMACTVLASQVVGVMIPAGPGMIGTSQFFTQLGLSIFVPGALAVPAVAARAAGYANAIWILQFGQQVLLGLAIWAGAGFSLRAAVSPDEARLAG